MGEHDSRPGEFYPFQLQHATLARFVAAVATETTPGSHHPVAWNVWPFAGAHDVPDRASRARSSGEFGDVAVGRHPPPRDSPDEAEYARREICRVPLHLAEEDGRTALESETADVSAVPCACGMVMPLSAASVGARSAGDAGSL